MHFPFEPLEMSPEVQDADIHRDPALGRREKSSPLMPVTGSCVASTILPVNTASAPTAAPTAIVVDGLISWMGGQTLTLQFGGHGRGVDDPQPAALHQFAQPRRALIGDPPVERVLVGKWRHRQNADRRRVARLRLPRPGDQHSR